MEEMIDYVCVQDFRNSAAIYELQQMKKNKIDLLYGNKVKVDYEKQIHELEKMDCCENCKNKEKCLKYFNRRK